MSLYKIVVVPYAKSDVSGQVMVYLIPNSHKVPVKEVWIDFCLYSDGVGGINKAIQSCDEKYIDLFIPKIVNLVSKINTKDIFPDVYEHFAGGNILTEMIATINIDENGTTPVLKKYVPSESSSKSSKSVEILKIKVGVPYIAFIYDLNLKRIAFFIKDENFTIESENRQLYCLNEPKKN